MQATERRLHHPVAGWFTAWTQLTDVSPPFVSFHHIVRFDGGDELLSDSTLRFRDRQEVAESLERAGFAVLEVRDAPDRPGLELVFVSRRGSTARLTSRLDAEDAADAALADAAAWWPAPP